MCGCRPRTTRSSSTAAPGRVEPPIFGGDLLGIDGPRLVLLMAGGLLAEHPHQQLTPELLKARGQAPVGVLGSDRLRAPAHTPDRCPTRR